VNVKIELMNATNETVSALVDRLVDASAREDEELDYKQALTLATDDRTNSILVSGPREQVADVEKIVAELDKPQPTEKK